MYLPKNKFKVKYSNGGEFTKSDGSDFIGPYIETSGGKFIEGDSLINAKDQIIPVPKEETFTDVDFPFNDYIGPSDEDYLNGSFIRFIVRDTVTKEFKEVNEKRFIRFSKLPRYEGIEIVWYLFSPVETEVKTSYIIEGSSSKNFKTINELEKTYTGISNFLNSFDYLVKK